MHKHKPRVASLSIDSLSDTGEPFLRDDTLTLAAARGEWHTVTRYLRALVEPDLTPRGKPSALCYATISGHCQAVQELIQFGADVNFHDGQGNTPCIYAVMSGSPDALCLLLEFGADPARTNRHDRNAYDYCRRHPRPCGRIIRMLSEYMGMMPGLYRDTEHLRH